MSQKEKWKHLRRIFFKSKGLFTCFSLLLSLLLIVGSTYAWITSDDQRINRAEANRKQLSARIDEDFTQVFHWAPGTTKTKEVCVTNDGEVPAIVRVAFHEFFLGFETDVTDNHRKNDLDVKGNANLVVYTNLAGNAEYVNQKETSTWKDGSYYSFVANKYYKANKAIINDSDDHDLAYAYNDSSRTLPLKAIELNFTPGSVFDEPAQLTGTETNYWYYENGYFYYSEVLKPGETTTDLLKTVTLTAEYSNQYKGALYKLVPVMDAHDITEALTEHWKINQGDYAYTLYENKLTK